MDSSVSAARSIKSWGLLTLALVFAVWIICQLVALVPRAKTTLLSLDVVLPTPTALLFDLYSWVALAVGALAATALAKEFLLAGAVARLAVNGLLVVLLLAVEAWILAALYLPMMSHLSRMGQGAS